MENLTPIISTICTFVAAPAIVFLFIYKNKKNKIELEKLKIQKEILELEIEKENKHIKVLEEENKKYDNLIDSSSKS